MSASTVAEISGVEKAAVLMVSLGTLTSAEIFKRLEPEEIKKLSAGIIALKSVDPETKAAVLADFTRVRSLAARGSATNRNFAAEIIESSLGSPQDAVSFEDIAKLDDPSIKVVLEEVDRRTLCLALKAAGDDVKSAVCRNLAAAEADDLRNEIRRMGAVRLNAIEKAQASVAAVMASCRVAKQAETIR